MMNELRERGDSPVADKNKRVPDATGLCNRNLVGLRDSEGQTECTGELTGDAVRRTWEVQPYIGTLCDSCIFYR